MCHREGTSLVPAVWPHARYTIWPSIADRRVCCRRLTSIQAVGPTGDVTLTLGTHQHLAASGRASRIGAVIDDPAQTWFAREMAFSSVIVDRGPIRTY